MLMDHLSDLESDDLEGDVYQCGKCEDKFTRLRSFMNHKKEKCSRKSKLVSEMSVSICCGRDTNRHYITQWSVLSQGNFYIHCSWFYYFLDHKRMDIDIAGKHYKPVICH